MPENTISEAPRPGADLYRLVKAGFVAKGTTFTAYCHSAGIIPSNGRQALLGSWTGPRGREVVRKLVEASGLTAKSSSAA